MENFIAYNPTVLHFGKNILTTLPETLKKTGKRALLVYGKNSVKKSGLRDRIVAELLSAGIQTVEYEGIQSNPLIEDIDAAAALGRKHNIDVILAIGGGSIIDSAKIISITIPVECSGWDFMSGKVNPVNAIPVISVLTLAATGSEMNPNAVISNHKLGLKSAFSSPLIFPKHSFLDPGLTLTVPKNYTEYGIADLIAHCFEAWFGIGTPTLTDRFVAAIIDEAMLNGPKLINNLGNYELRERIMFAATMALNGLTMYGRASGDWGVHAAGHCLSLLYNIPHGASLTIVYPAWFKLFKNQVAERMIQLGSALFHEPLTADQFINRIETFFKTIDCPTRLSDLNITADAINPVYESMVRNQVNGAHIKFSNDDYRKLIELFL